MKYRPEIDGLRAFAVLPVLFFHASFPYFQGGYVGVDIFFVISGFLITSIILSDLDKGKFSLKNFYDKRARRILPVLFFILFLSTLFSLLWLPPHALVDYSKSLLSVLGFSSNIYFWKSIDYFNPGTENKPLLHTWSLAVEEQFYFIFPLILIAVWKRSPKHIVKVLYASFLLSFILSEFGRIYRPSANFYLPFSRGWELMMGSLAAFYERKQKIPKNNFLSLLGMSFIGFGVVFYNETTPFPSYYAIAPTLGALLVILFAKEGTLVHRLLSLKPFVAVGLISYSLYLWHQPLFALLRMRSFVHPSSLWFGLGILVCFGLSFLSWKFIENPIRDREHSIFSSAKKTYLVIGAGFLVLFSLSALIVFKEGVPERFSPQSLAFLKNESLISKKYFSCNFEPKLVNLPSFSFKDSQCLKENRKASLLIWGDSHAFTPGSVLIDKLEREGHSAHLISINGCVPFLNINSRSRDCQTSVSKVLNHIKESSYQSVLLISRLQRVFHNTHFNNSEGGVEEALPYKDQYYFLNGASLESSLKETIDRLRETSLKKISILYPIPEAGWHVPEQAFRRTAFGKNFDGNLSTPFKAFKKRVDGVHNILDQLDNLDDKIQKIKPEDQLCDSKRCFNIIKGNLLYRDSDHLSEYGSMLLWHKMQTVP